MSYLAFGSLGSPGCFFPRAFGFVVEVFTTGVKAPCFFWALVGFLNSVILGSLRILRASGSSATELHDRSVWRACWRCGEKKYMGAE